MSVHRNHVQFVLVNSHPYSVQSSAFYKSTRKNIYIQIVRQTPSWGMTKLCNEFRLSKLLKALCHNCVDIIQKLGPYILL